MAGKSVTERVIKKYSSQPQPRTPIASGGDEGIFLPNHSGIASHPEAKKNFATTSHTHVAADVTDFDTEVSNNTDVAANTAARHAAVTIGTANGLSLSTQQLSLAAASGSTTGALSSTDWTTFNNKQSALGTDPSFTTVTATSKFISSPAKDFFSEDIHILDIGNDDTVQLDGTHLGIYWSNYATGAGEFQFKTDGGNYAAIRASAFSGSGSSLTALNAGNISSGTLAIARGGTNATSYGADRVVYMNSGNTAFSSDSNFIYSSSNLLVGATTSAGDFRIQGTNSSTGTIRVGVYGAATNGSSINAGIRGIGSGGAGDNIGTFGRGEGNSGTKYGIYGTATGTGTNWAGYFAAAPVMIEQTLNIGNTDTNLYRQAANVLRTDDTFRAGGYQDNSGNAGATVLGSFFDYNSNEWYFNFSQGICLNFEII